jgi:hypothetical protein
VSHPVEILVVALIAALLLLVEHYWPGERFFQKRFHQTTNYALGTLALIVPECTLFALWGMWEAVMVIAVTTIAGGLAVLGAYALDNWIQQRDRAEVAEREAKELRPGGECDPRKNQE